MSELDDIFKFRDLVVPIQWHAVGTDLPGGQCRLKEDEVVVKQKGNDRAVTRSYRRKT